MSRLKNSKTPTESRTKCINSVYRAVYPLLLINNPPANTGRMFRGKSYMIYMYYIYLHLYQSSNSFSISSLALGAIYSPAFI